MKRFPLFLLFTLLTLSTVPAQADIIDDTIGNIQQAINDAYNPDRGRDYEDSRDYGWQREVSDDRRRQYDDRRALAQAAHSQPHAGTPCAPPVPVSVRVRLMLQRLGEAEVALLVAFTQVKTVCVVALHVGGKLGHFGPGLAGFFFCPCQ